MSEMTTATETTDLRWLAIGAVAGMLAAGVGPVSGNCRKHSKSGAHSRITVRASLSGVSSSRPGDGSVAQRARRLRYAVSIAHLQIRCEGFPAVATVDAA